MTSEELELQHFPLAGNAGRGSPFTPSMPSGDSGLSEEMHSARVVAERNAWLGQPWLIAVDLVASVLFWYMLLFVPLPTSASVSYALGGSFLAALLLYRLWLRQARVNHLGLPYTCGVATSNDKELYLVATLHISPRAPRDVDAVVERTNPDIVMIELDEERLDRMRDEETGKSMAPMQADLQPIRLHERGRQDLVTLYAQRALWNGEWGGKVISAELVHDDSDPFGMTCTSHDLAGRIALVKRGSANNEFAPFALKAHKAFRAGAEAVVVIDTEGAPLPAHRLGSGTMHGELKTWWHTCNCGFPELPVLLLPHEEGARLLESLHVAGQGAIRAELEIMADSYPRRTLRRRVCQGMALLFSGIGILYGVIQCFAIDVGAEFLAAEIAATAKQIPCVCIDVDLDRFWSRLGWALLPTPRNIMNSGLAWLAFPRILFRVFFPADGSVDLPGSMVLHAMSFSLRTWVAFLLAGFCASFITSNLLQLFSSGAEAGAEAAGVVHAQSDEDRAALQAYFMLAIEMYMMPRVYDAIAASRDEAMYVSIVAKASSYTSNRMVVVVGAGHANGILQRVMSRGL